MNFEKLTPEKVLKEAEDRAKTTNKARTLVEKITSKNKTRAVDLLHEEANTDNEAFELKRKAEEVMDQHLVHLLVSNVTKRQAYLELKEGEYGEFLSHRTQDDALSMTEGNIRHTVYELDANDNDLTKLRGSWAASFGEKEAQSRFEDHGERYKNLAQQLTAEKKRIALLKETKQRHPDNPLFKDHFLRTPKGVQGNYTSVFCATKEGALDHVGQEGLKFGGEGFLDETTEVVGGVRNSSKVDLERVFKEAAPEGYNRRLSVFAVPEYRDPDRAGAMGGMGNIVLEMTVDADKAMVFDVEIYNAMAENMLSDYDPNDPRFIEAARETAAKYWSGGMKLSDYLKLSLAKQRELFVTPEILIPETVSPSAIKVVSVLEGKN